MANRMLLFDLQFCSPCCAIPDETVESAESLLVKFIIWGSIQSQKLESSHGMGLKVTSLLSSRRTSYRHRGLQETSAALELEIEPQH